MDSTSSKEDFFKYAAMNFAGTAMMSGMTASVHVEGIDDIPFWRSVLGKFYPKGKFNFIAYSKTYSGSNASGSMHCLSYRNYLSDKFFICIDSDERYLSGEPDIDIKHFILQTYTYSIENHYCYAPKLNMACSKSAGIRNDIFDFVSFFTDYSRIIYDIFIWHRFFVNNNSTELSVIPFNNIITIKGKIPLWQLQNNGEVILERIKQRVDNKLEHLTKTYPDVDIDKLKEHYAQLGVCPDNVYLFIRGHHLLSFVTKIGEKCCEQLLYRKKKQIKRNNKNIKQIHAKTIPFKHVVIDRIWFDDYYCMNRMKQDIDDFFMTSNSTSTHLQNH